MAISRIRAVYDCNVLWRAFFFKTGIGNDCRRLIDDKIIQHVMSRDTVEELVDVLTREETLNRFPYYSPDDAKDFVREIVNGSTLIRTVPPATPLSRDLDDEAYLNLAVAVEADFLVTFDRDLLDLITGTDIESKQFRQRFRHLRIVRPDEFLSIALGRELPLGP